MSRKERIALISVWDKQGIVPFAKGLREAGFRILSTGGTAAALRDGGVEVEEVSHHTGFPEILGGRVKTLHPKIHGGLLGRPDREADRKQMAEQGIAPIELAVVNLYPFSRTAADPEVSRSDLVEMIDIGGPTMVRAAAKNHAHVGIVVDPADYDAVGEEIRNPSGLSGNTRRRLAIKAFRHTSVYDAGIVTGLTRALDCGPEETAVPDQLLLGFEKALDLRYGENPHQQAGFYRPLGAPPAGLGAARKLQGKELSYNNLLDCDAAWRCVTEFASTAAVVVKHTNPCGVALGDNPREAFLRARETDPVSSFGGIVAFNRPVDADAAGALAEQFLECLIAPDFDQEARQVLARKKNLRLLAMGEAAAAGPAWDLRTLSGSLLVQECDRKAGLPADARVVTKRPPTDEERRALDFAWRVVKHVKSNAVVFCRADRTAAVGAGQMSRVDSVKIAQLKATAPLEGTVAASDAFFPFRDGLEVLADAGATAVVQPGGSIRDKEVIAAADEKGVAMVFTGYRHFRH